MNFRQVINARIKVLLQETMNSFIFPICENELRVMEATLALLEEFQECDNN